MLKSWTLLQAPHKTCMQETHFCATSCTFHAFLTRACLAHVEKAQCNVARSRIYFCQKGEHKNKEINEGHHVFFFEESLHWKIIRRKLKMQKHLAMQMVPARQGREKRSTLCWKVKILLLHVTKSTHSLSSHCEKNSSFLLWNEWWMHSIIRRSNWCASFLTMKAQRRCPFWWIGAKNASLC